MAFVFNCPICGKSTGTFMRIGEHCKCRQCGNDIIVPADAEKTSDFVAEQSSLQLPQSLQQIHQANFSFETHNLAGLARTLAWIAGGAFFLFDVFMFSSIPDSAGGLKYLLPLTASGAALMMWVGMMIQAQLLDDLRAIRNHLEKSQNEIRS